MINPKELLLVVDESDHPLETLPRKEVHADMLLHRISHIWVIDDQKRVLVQKRSLQKDKWPGMWECWFGGHVLADDTYLETAVLETKEEIGLQVKPENLSLFAKKRVTNTQENIFVSVYGLQRSLDIASIKLEAEEVELVKWLTIAELRGIYKVKDSLWVCYGYELEVLGWLEEQF
jgi:isopentenyldiphosphate isomerase